LFPDFYRETLPEYRTGKRKTAILPNSTLVRRFRRIGYNSLSISSISGTNLLQQGRGCGD
jgi:hypothetical protein